MDRQVQWLPPDCMLAQTPAGGCITQAFSGFRGRCRLQDVCGTRSGTMHISYTRGGV